jgi:putative membrane protein
MGDWSWGWGIAGMLMMTVFWVSVILLTIYAVRALTGQRDSTASARPRQTDVALDVLRERYARGEIDRDEFQERRRALEDSTHSP